VLGQAAWARYPSFLMIFRKQSTMPLYCSPAAAVPVCSCLRWVLVSDGGRQSGRVVLEALHSGLDDIKRVPKLANVSTQFPQTVYSTATYITKI
jgi:hypothetical protein